MRSGRLLVLAAILAAFIGLGPYGRAQEAPKENAGAEDRSEPGIGWQLANFALLAAGLGYLIAKNAGKFFASRDEQIQRGLAEAAKARQEGEQRIAEMEQRLAGLAGEIERLRSDMRREMAAEGERIRVETERHIRHIEEQAEQEIENMTKVARRELKMYSAELALSLAEEQLKGRVTREVENNLLSSFIADIRTKAGGGNTHN